MLVIDKSQVLIAWNISRNISLAVIFFRIMPLYCGSNDLQWSISRTSLQRSRNFTQKEKYNETTYAKNWSLIKFFRSGETEQRWTYRYSEIKLRRIFWIRTNANGILYFYYHPKKNKFKIKHFSVRVPRAFFSTWLQNWWSTAQVNSFLCVG